jgi:MGT family glycosyltransferase
MLPYKILVYLLMQLKGNKILFASSALDGHFNPLTGLAKHLQNEGCDVRWYTSTTFKNKLVKLDIPFYPFENVKEFNLEDPAQTVERNAIKDPMEKMNYDFINIFIERGPEFYADILKIHRSFPFDVMVTENAFTGIPFVRQKMNIPVVVIGIVPLPESAAELGPYGLALPPAEDDATVAAYAQQNEFMLNVLFKQAVDAHERTFNQHGIIFERSLFPNLLVKQASLYLQIGAPGFEYQRNELGKNIRFVGALLPYRGSVTNKWYDERLKQYDKIVLVTQGTVEKDTKKLIEPTLDAFTGTDVLVIVTTAGNNTAELRQKYNAPNVIIEDYIPFNDVMPYANVYITNGGYGGALLSLTNKLPMVAAGVHEGKAEICARIGYFKAGVNLNTEFPTMEAIYEAANDVMANEIYRNNAIRICDEMEQFDAESLCAYYIKELLTEQTTLELKA